MSKPLVSIARCPDYDAEHVARAVRKVVDALPEAGALLTPGATVLLKPNLLSASQPPEHAVNTHFEVIRAVARLCRDNRCRVLIGDSCGTLTAGSTRRAMAVSHLPAVADETGAELVDFDTAPARDVAIPNGRILKTVRVAAAVCEADVVITLPKLKTHGLTLLTGAIKNQFGIVPGKGKKDIHRLAPKPSSLAEALVDIFSVARPHIALMDAVVAMEGNGPAGGRPRGVGLVLASTDAVALDAVAGDIIGYPPNDILPTRLAARRGLGCGRLEDILIDGPERDALRQRDFRRPSAGLRRVAWGIVPSRLARGIIDCLGNLYPRIRHESCVLCGECITNCPAGALELDNATIVLQPRRCIQCYCCAEACPHRSIEFTNRWITGRTGIMRKESKP